MLHKTRRTSDYVARTQALTDLQEALDLAEAPLRIECFDVSHLGGTNVVASMVVFEDGLPRKDQYRSFGVPETTDDTDSLYQVLDARLAYLDRPEEDEPHAAPEPTADGEVVTEREPPRFAYRPQLLVVDGGKPQVEAAARALRDAGHEEIALCGIAKRLEEVWLPGEEYPVILPRTSEALYLLQRLRDEAHRFAITHQRRRRRRDIQSVLSEVPGPRRGPHQGAAAALRLGRGAEEGDAGRDRRAAGHRSEARRGDPRAPLALGRLVRTTGVVMSDEARRASAGEVLIVTGMSGAGRSTAANALEDLDWYVVDNLPPQMLKPLLDLTELAGGVAAAGRGRRRRARARPLRRAARRHAGAARPAARSG